MLSRDKKGISVMIGYVLLISIAVVIGALVYTWMKTWTPADDNKCSEDVSLVVQEINCKEGSCGGTATEPKNCYPITNVTLCVQTQGCRLLGNGSCSMMRCRDRNESLCISENNCTWSSEKTLELLLRNNGLFDIDGYYIYASNDTNQQIATVDLSARQIFGKNDQGIVIVPQGIKPSAAGQEHQNSFNVSSLGIIKFIEIIPFLFETKGNKKVMQTCGNAKLREEFTCG